MADEWTDYFDEMFESDDRDYEDLLFGNSLDVDPHAQRLFSDWMEDKFNEGSPALRELITYMDERYDIDFLDVFDWEDFREWYESQ